MPTYKKTYSEQISNIFTKEKNLNINHKMRMQVYERFLSKIFIEPTTEENRIDGFQDFL
jgi:hypothetical protein